MLFDIQRTVVVYFDHADAQRQVKLVIALVVLVEIALQSLHDPCGVPEPEVGRQDRKLIATQSRHDIRG
ncbi:MAG TPA: hypothetical protein VHH35_12655 [Pyrinomonadaceae bacterium]|nr:hypothetical protein [Pyrinomonadaceae bacterium]